MSIAVLAAVAWPAVAESAPRVHFDLRYGTEVPDAPTSLHVRISYRPADGSDGKAPGTDGLVLHVPAGARFAPGARPLCTATDATLRVLGRDACPPGSRVGGGTLTVDPGLVAPLTLDLHAFATPQGFVEVVQMPRTNVTLGLDRFDVDGERLTAHPPFTPGGPPDWRTTVRDVDLRLDDAGGYVRTPRTCDTGTWTASAVVTFAGGARETATSASACRRPVARRRTCRTRGRREARRHDRTQRCRSRGPRRGLAR